MTYSKVKYHRIDAFEMEGCRRMLRICRTSQTSHINGLQEIGAKETHLIYIKQKDVLGRTRYMKHVYMRCVNTLKTIEGTLQVKRGKGRLR